MSEYLKPGNFSINHLGELCNDITNGLSFVYFFSTTCQYCEEIDPVFRSIVKTFQGCTFAFMNVEQERRAIVRLSKMSKMPLDIVPYFILYNGGRPIAAFEPLDNSQKQNYDNMYKFLLFHSDRVRRSKVGANVGFSNSGVSNAGFSNDTSSLSGSANYGSANYGSANYGNRNENVQRQPDGHNYGTDQSSGGSVASTPSSPHTTGIPISMSGKKRRACYLTVDESYSSR